MVNSYVCLLSLNTKDITQGDPNMIRVSFCDKAKKYFIDLHESSLQGAEYWFCTRYQWNLYEVINTKALFHRYYYRGYFKLKVKITLTYLIQIIKLYQMPKLSHLKHIFLSCLHIAILLINMMIATPPSTTKNISLSTFSVSCRFSMGKSYSCST